MQINEIELSNEAKTALYKIVHQTSGIDPKDIAAITNDSHKTILNYANRNMENHLPSLKKFEAIQKFTQNPAMLKVWAHQLGLMLVPVPNIDTELCEKKSHQVSVVEQLLPVNVNTGSLNQTIHKILEDGVITPCEMHESIEIVQEMMANLHVLQKAIEATCAVYLAKAQTEKA
ncbi:phage regulatory CII family protein [Acinetobacter pollinis]|uniref:phage regulatory CII family protein n=1 Tax=Acinetobacter pollinis TaxID=2605270 RepID=UPI001BB444A0|nr:phage regulatory CII family protein [Acinetobacter pollinis]